ncbi:MAG: cell division protein [Pyramidobacter sp.]|nr:cell division protein [Pyramidobacter sp.]MBR1895663.1 cell division protein [Pyramidobacter sp.]
MKLRWVVFWAVVGLGIAMLVTSVLNEFDRQKRMAELIREKEAALVQAQDRLSRLRERVQFFKTKEGQAWLAREKLNMAFSGEEIYKIEGEPRSADKPATK